MSPKRAVLKLAQSTGLATLAQRATGAHLRILCYHGLWVTPGYSYGNCLFMRPRQFEARMARLKRSGRPVLPLGEAVARLEANDLPPASVVITIDDGWESTLTHMLPVLERYELPATLYATTWYAGRELPVVNVAVHYLLAASGRGEQEHAAIVAAIEALDVDDRLEAVCELSRALGVDTAWLEHRQFHLMGPDALAQASERGLDIQLHTHRHIDVRRQIGRLGSEVEENRAFIAEAVGGEPARHFCYPSGTHHPRAPEVLAANGVRSATLVEEGINAPHANPFELRRFVDARAVSDVEFDAYLSGTLHYLSELRGIVGRARREVPACAAAASGMLFCTV